MKILHLMLACFYIDNYSYQENYLPKYHKLLGNEVKIVASLFTFDKNGKGTYLDKKRSYINEYGIPVSRLEYSNFPASKVFRKYKGLKNEIEEFSPDVIFIHGLQFCDIKIVARYCKLHPATEVYIDNHSDFSNSARNFASKVLLHGIIWKKCASVITPFTKKFYGVLPARVDFLVDVYGIPKDKVELLVMGADDDLVNNAKENLTSKNLREKFNIDSKDFLIVTGGKIDKWKTQIIFLIKAVKNMKSNVKLLIFGSIIPELKNDIMNLVDQDKIIYVGWIPSVESYDYFQIADLVVFPGRHSVLWEQATAQGLPLVVKYWKGTTHIDLGGNVKFLYNDSVDEIYTIIMEIISNKNELIKMKEIAKEKGSQLFLYSKIAEKSLT